MMLERGIQVDHSTMAQYGFQGSKTGVVIKMVLASLTLKRVAGWAESYQTLGMTT